MNKRIGIILQARMGSTRLPGKVLMKIGKTSMLEYIIARLSHLRHDSDFIIATTLNQVDDTIAKLCKSNGIKCFRGSENNVLERYYLCARMFDFRHVVRITGDNPFVDIEELDRLIDLHINMKSEYSSSIKALPKGAGAEIFSFNALEGSFLNGKENHHLEHVNEYILENPPLFKTYSLEVKRIKERPDISLTVDTLEDFLKARYIVEKSESDYITTEEAIELCMQYA